ncbi:MAG: hypothetical protein CL946_11970 [Ectothiorhodospiraceae bacterium]|nr:hypothetical protein [Ectothiorhodospiraceae bacterium]
MEAAPDIYTYSVEHVIAQIANAPKFLGAYEMRFYIDGIRRPSKEKTATMATFYYYPSGGTIRDEDMNILFYEPKLDIYKDFDPTIYENNA